MRGCGGVGLVIGWSIACSPGSFVCQSDAQCVSSGVDGQCLDDGFCGFPDSDCLSGLRYGDGSGDVSGQCAPEQGGGSTSTTTASAETSSSDGNATSSSSGPAVDDSATDTGTTTGGDTGPVSTTTSAESSGDTDSSDTGEPIDPSLVLWLRFDDVVEDGMWLDSSGYDHHGICSECPSLSEGVDGFGARFDGESTYVEVPHSDLLSTPEGFTIAAWIRMEQPPQEQRSIVTKAVGEGVYNSWELYFFPGDPECPDCLLLSMAVGDGDETIFSPQPVSIGEWVHVAGTWDGQTMTMWIDGQPMDERDVFDLQMDDHPILVGVDDDHDPATPLGLDGYFDGFIDDVRLYDRQLDDGEIAELASF